MGSADISRSPTIRHVHTAGSGPRMPVDTPDRSGARRTGTRMVPSALVLSADALALSTPVLSDARQLSATISMTVLSLLLIAAAGRYRAPLHLSVLDDLPAIVSRLVVAMAVVATIVALRGGREDVATFLGSCGTAVVLLIGGRVMTTRLIGRSRERGHGVRRTLMVGGGALAAELADVLDNDGSYGLAVVGYVDDEQDRPASDLVPRLGRQSDVDSVVRATGVDTLIVTPDTGSECALFRLLRTEECLGCDIFVVPRLYHLHLQPSPIERIG